MSSLDSAGRPVCAPAALERALDGGVVFVGDLGRLGRPLALAIGDLGYVVHREASVGMLATRGGRPPIGVVLECSGTHDPFRAVRWLRRQPDYVHAVVFVCGDALEPNDAMCAGADDLLDRLAAPAEDLVDRIASRIARGRSLEARAFYDHVTQVYNRRFVSERLSSEIVEAVAGAERAALGVAVVLRARAVRDASGLGAMDRMLEDAAFALRARTRTADIVARVCDDTFILLAPGMTSLEAAMAHPAITRDGEVVVDLAFAEAPRDGLSWQTLFDVAMRSLERRHAS